MAGYRNNQLHIKTGRLSKREYRYIRKTNEIVCCQSLDGGNFPNAIEGSSEKKYREMKIQEERKVNHLHVSLTTCRGWCCTTC